MKILAVILTSLFLLTSAFADKAITCYSAPASGTIARGCVQVFFLMKTFTGTISNATFGAVTTNTFNVETVGDGTTLSAIPYTRTSAVDTLYVCEVR